MGVRFKFSETYKTQVNFTVLTESGKAEALAFEAQFKRLTREQVKEVIDESKDDAEIVRKVLVSWKMQDMDSKEDIAFTDQVLDEFLQIPGSAGVTALRFLETVGAAKAKN